MTTAKKRSRIVAFVLSILLPGLGHAYAARLGRGAALFAMSLALRPVLLALPLGLHPVGFWIIIGVLVLYRPVVGIDAARQVRRMAREPLPTYAGWPSLIAVWIAALPVLWLHGTYVDRLPRRADPYRIPVPTYKPTLMVGDFIVADRAVGDVERGELVVFDVPDETPHGIHRVVAVGGDSVELRNGVVYLDGARAPQPVQSTWKPNRYEDEDVDAEVHDASMNVEPVAVPKAFVFVLSDDRSSGYDSRVLGPIPVAAVVAKPKFIWFSHLPDEGVRWDRIGRRVQ